MKGIKCVFWAILLAVVMCVCGCAGSDESGREKKSREKDKIQIGLCFDSFVIERWQRDRDVLTEIQRNLFVVGGSLAGAKSGNPLTTEGMEAEIDRLTAIVEEAQEDKRFHFILPGGSRAAALAHVCRTVCRRAERAMLRVDPTPSLPNGGRSSMVNAQCSMVNGEMLRYVNRLSDYLFILARKLNVDNSTKDVIL